MEYTHSSLHHVAATVFTTLEPIQRAYLFGESFSPLICFNCVLLKDSISRRRSLCISEWNKQYLGALIFRFSASGMVGMSLWGGGGAGAFAAFMLRGRDDAGGGGGFLLTGSGGGTDEVVLFIGGEDAGLLAGGIA